MNLDALRPPRPCAASRSPCLWSQSFTPRSSAVRERSSLRSGKTMTSASSSPTKETSSRWGGIQETSLSASFFFSLLTESHSFPRPLPGSDRDIGVRAQRGGGASGHPAAGGRAAGDGESGRPPGPQDPRPHHRSSRQSHPKADGGVQGEVMLLLRLCAWCCFHLITTTFSSCVRFLRWTSGSPSLAPTSLTK